MKSGEKKSGGGEEGILGLYRGKIPVGRSTGNHFLFKGGHTLYIETHTYRVDQTSGRCSTHSWLGSGSYATFDVNHIIAGKS